MADENPNIPPSIAPGQVIAPQTAVSAPDPAVTAPTPPTPPQAAPVQAVKPVQPPSPAGVTAPEPIAPPQTAEQLLGGVKPVAYDSDATYDQDGGIAWTASEFIAHEKAASWYVMVGAVALVIAALTYAATKDAVSAGIILIVAAFFGYYGSRKPRQLPYRVDEDGLTIGDKQYSYDDYKSFVVVPEGAFSSITLLPLKRFGAPVSIYFSPDLEDDIIDMLAEHMPGEVGEHDLLEKLMRRVRF